jgi:hypothetical protein
MKRTFITAITLLIISLFSYKSAFSNYPLSVGPFIGLKAGINAADIPYGYKNGFTFNKMPEIGISGFIPFGQESNFGAGLDLAYGTYGFVLKYNNINTDHVYNYFNFSPYINASGFILGLNIGIPLSGTQTTSGVDVDRTDSLSTLLEIRIGGNITVFANETGRLNILIIGGYALSGLLTNPYKADAEYNYHPGELYIGLGYMFNLMKPVPKDLKE